MQPKPLLSGSASVLLLPALLGLALLSGCGEGAPPPEVQQANIQGEVEAEQNPQNPEVTGRQRPGPRDPSISVE